jgi:hypothetical protein
MVGSYPCPQILDYGGIEWQGQTALAYYKTVIITDVKRFIVLATGMF